MKPITHYISILAAIEFKNVYKDVASFLEENINLKDLGFNPVVTELNPNYGIKMLRLIKDRPPAQVQVNQIRIQYEDNNVPIEKTDQISEVINQLKQARKKITDNEEINFQGAILQGSYDFEGNELLEIKKKFFDYGNEFKQGELKLSFRDSNKLNYNIIFIFKEKKLIVNFDINNRYVDDKNYWNIDKIVNKIKEYTENNANLLKIINLKQDDRE